MSWELCTRAWTGILTSMWSGLDVDAVFFELRPREEKLDRAPYCASTMTRPMFEGERSRLASAAATVPNSQERERTVRLDLLLTPALDRRCKKLNSVGSLLLHLINQLVVLLEQLGHPPVNKSRPGLASDHQTSAFRRDTHFAARLRFRGAR